MLSLSLSLSCGSQNKPDNDLIFVASTPADSTLRNSFGITYGEKIDFIKWVLTLSQPDGRFHLHINYGEGKPNTSGFYNDGQSKTYQGTYANSMKGAREYIEFRSADLAQPFYAMKLNENLFQLLSHDGSMLKGNAGWSYALNRKPALKDKSLPASLDVPVISDSMVFEGRTPCSEIATDLLLSVPRDCFKLKWKLILRAQPSDSSSGNYIIRRTDSRQQEITGKWNMTPVRSSRGESWIIKLSGEGKDLSLLIADKNTLLLLSQAGELYVGNELFSYVLNRRYY